MSFINKHPKAKNLGANITQVLITRYKHGEKPLKIGMGYKAEGKTLAGYRVRKGRG